MEYTFAREVLPPWVLRTEVPTLVAMTCEDAQDLAVWRTIRWLMALSRKDTLALDSRTIAEIARVDVKTVLRCISGDNPVSKAKQQPKHHKKGLVALGLLEITGQQQGRGRPCSVYRIPDRIERDNVEYTRQFLQRTIQQARTAAHPLEQTWLPFAELDPFDPKTDQSPGVSGDFDPKTDQSPGASSHFDPKTDQIFDPKTDQSPGASGDFDPKTDQSPGASGDFDPKTDQSPGASSHFDPKTDQSPGASGDFDPKTDQIFDPKTDQSGIHVEERRKKKEEESRAHSRDEQESSDTTTWLDECYAPPKDEDFCSHPKWIPAAALSEHPIRTWELIHACPSTALDQRQLRQAAKEHDHVTNNAGWYWVGRAIMAASISGPADIAKIRTILKRWKDEDSYGSDRQIPIKGGLPDRGSLQPAPSTVPSSSDGKPKKLW